MAETRFVRQLDEKFRRASLLTDTEWWSICWVTDIQPTVIRILWLENGAPRTEGIMRSRITTLQLMR